MCRGDSSAQQMHNPVFEQIKSVHLRENLEPSPHHGLRIGKMSRRVVHRVTVAVDENSARFQDAENLTNHGLAVIVREVMDRVIRNDDIHVRIGQRAERGQRIGFDKFDAARQGVIGEIGSPVRSAFRRRCRSR